MLPERVQGKVIWRCIADLLRRVLDAVSELEAWGLTFQRAFSIAGS